MNKKYKVLLTTLLFLSLVLSDGCGDDGTDLDGVNSINLRVTSVGDQWVRLSWSGIQNESVAYLIYRDGDSAPRSISETNYTDTGIRNGVEYRYQVAGLNSEGAELVRSNEVTATPDPDSTPDPTPPLFALNNWSFERILLPGNSDIFETRLEARLYRISTSASLAASSIILMDTDGREVPRVDGSYLAPSAGEYSVMIDNSGTEAVSYRLLMRYDDCAGGLSSACSAGPGGGFIRCIETPGDDDWYQITLKEHHTYEISAFAGATPQCSVAPFNPEVTVSLNGTTEEKAAVLRLALKSVDGTQLYENYAPAFEALRPSLSGITVASDSIHYISISAQSATNKTGEYTFTIFETVVPITEESDCPGDASTLCVTEPSRVYEGGLDHGGADNADWIKITLSEAGSYFVGVRASPGDLKFSEVRLVGSGSDDALIRIRDGKIYERRNLGLMPGEYTLRIMSEAGSGSYRVSFVSE